MGEDSGERITFQVVLFEGSNEIYFNYNRVKSAGSSKHMIGIENQAGSMGLRYSGFDDAGIRSSMVTVRFYPGDGSAIDPDDIDNDGDGFTENQGDCNDSNASIHPGALEICGDGIDQDCNGRDLDCNNTIDPDDIDNDGDGYTENRGDCNDFNASIHPGALEICGDGVDQNCDGYDQKCSGIDPPDIDPLTATLYFTLFKDDFIDETYIGLLNNSETETLEGELIAFNKKGYSLNELSGTKNFKVVLDKLARVEVPLSDILPDGTTSGVAYVKFVGEMSSGLGYCRIALDGTGRSAAYPAAYKPQTDIYELQLPWLNFNDGWKTRVGLLNISPSWVRYEVEFNNGTSFGGVLNRDCHAYLDISGELEVDLPDGTDILLKNSSPQPTAATIKLHKNDLESETILVGAALYQNESILGAISLKPGSTPLITYPYIVQNNGWWTSLTAYNPAIDMPEGDCPLTLKPFDSQGKINPDPGLEFENYFSVFSAVNLFADPLLRESGWVEAENSCSIVGLQIIGSADSQQMGFVSAFDSASRSGVLARFGDGWTGVVLLNPGAELATVKMVAYSERGDYLTEKRVNLEPRKQAVLALVDIAGTTSQVVSSIRYTATNPIMALLINGKDYDVEGETLKQMDILPALMVETTGSQY